MKAWVTLLLVVLWLALAALLRQASVSDWDLRIADHYYDGALDQPWPEGEASWTTKADRYGRWPAVLVGLGLLGAALRRWRRGEEWRRAAALVALLVLGPGVLVHGMKAVWGRERPRDVFHWKRPVPYQEWWQPQGPAGGPSFPSGHAASAAALVAIAAIGLRRRPALAVVGSLLAGGFAVVVSWARLADGAHFFCDVTAAWLLVLSTTIALRPWWGRPPPATVRDQVRESS